MPSIRIGLTTDFNLVGERVGIGTTNPTATLEVAGEIRANNIISASSGVTTFTEYTGFLQPVQLISNTVSIAETTKGNLNSLSDEIKISGEVTIEPDVSVTGGRLDSLTTTDRFAVPLGETNNRDNAPEAGTTRFNQDFGTLEFFDGANWKTVNSYARGGAAGRAVFMAGEAPSPSYALSGKNISYANISSLGNSNNFGDLSLNGKYGGSGMSNSTRGVIAGGWNSSPGPGNQYDIEYITIASEGNAIDWGENNTGGWGSTGSSSSTRGLSAGGGYPSASVTIDSILFSTVGTKEDWGDITAYKGRGTTSCNDPTRSVFFGGYTPALQSTIEYKTTASNGNTVYFGELITAGRLMPGMSSSTRGVMGTKDYSAGDVGMGYITIASTGNAQYFGDLTVARSWGGATANQVRGLYVGGRQNSTYYNNIDYCTISSTGNFVDFGDLTGGNDMQKACVSDSHGGLGGF